MPSGPDIRNTPAEDLSALVDGELNDGAVATACGRWRSDAEARATWHAYQLIGDVLRSEDLASDAGRDAAFLSALRDRLAHEPVVIAPNVAPHAAPNSTQPAAAALAARSMRSRRWSWAGPSAVAAGFVVVAGVVVVMRGSLLAPQPEQRVSDASVPRSAVPAPGRPADASIVQVAEPPSQVANGQVIRDAGLDRYLAAHKQFAGSAGFGIPAARVRNATVDMPGR
jgi:sigma-E factor negative regulatory protein RseA